MAYLEVTTQNGADAKIAVSANGVSLAKSDSLSELFFGGHYPNAMAYFNELENEGWSLVSSSSTRVVGMIHGMPIAGGKETYIFRGYGRYEIEWVGDTWQFKVYQNETTKIEKKEWGLSRKEFFQLYAYDAMVRRVLIGVGKKIFTKQLLFLSLPSFKIDYFPPSG